MSSPLLLTAGLEPVGLAGPVVVKVTVVVGKIMVDKIMVDKIVVDKIVVVDTGVEARMVKVRELLATAGVQIQYVSP